MIRPAKSSMEDSPMPKTRRVVDILEDLIDIHSRNEGYNESCIIEGWARCGCHLAEAIRLIKEWVTEQERVRGVGNV